MSKGILKGSKLPAGSLEFSVLNPELSIFPPCSCSVPWGDLAGTLTTFLLCAALCNGLRSAKRPRSPLIHITSVNAIQSMQAFLSVYRVKSGEGGE